MTDIITKLDRWDVTYFPEDHPNVGFRVKKANVKMITREDLEELLVAVRLIESDILDSILQKKEASE